MVTNEVTNEKILRTLRHQAWCRAKGELEAVLTTFWDGPDNDQQYHDMESAVRQFVADVEDSGLAE